MMHTNRERAHEFSDVLRRAHHQATRGTPQDHDFDAEGTASFLIEGDDMAMSSFPYEIAQGLFSDPVDPEGCAWCEWGRGEHPSGPGWHDYVEPSNEVRTQRRHANSTGRSVTDRDVEWLAGWLTEANLNATDGQRIPDQIAHDMAGIVFDLLPERSLAVILATVSTT